MPNNFTVNPIVIDTASAGVSFGGLKRLLGVIVIASADTWSLVLTDASGGRTIFRADSDMVNHRSVYWSPAGDGVPIGSVYAATLTDIALALVYLDSTPIGTTAL